MEILKTDPLDSGLEKSEKQDGETGRCNQRHDCGAQGTQYGLNAFKTAVFIVKVRQCQTDDKGRYDTAQGTEDYAEGTGEPHADKG